MAATRGYLLMYIRQRQSCLCQNCWMSKRRYSTAEVTHARALLLSAGEKLGVKDQLDWLRVSKAELVQAGAGELLLDGRSMEDALASINEKGEIAGIKRGQAPRGHWDVDENCRDFLLASGKLMGLSTAEDWVTADASVLRSLGGDGLLRKGSLFSLLQQHIPEQLVESDSSATKGGDRGSMSRAEETGARGIDARLKVFKRKVPNRFWHEQKNRRQFLELVAAHFDVTSPEEWRRVRRSDVKALGGELLLAMYPSFFAAIEDNFPEIEWDVFQCRTHVPLGYWNDDENVKAFVRQLERVYHLETEEDWLRVSREQVAAVGHGASLMKKLPLKNVLQVVYPNRDWEQALKTSTKRATQRWMYLHVSQLFTGTQQRANDATLT